MQVALLYYYSLALLAANKIYVYSKEYTHTLYVSLTFPR